MAFLSATTQVVGHPTIRQGSRGPDVVAWQNVIGIKADGNFGPGTRKATIDWQRAHGLTADGVVGQATWSASFPPDAVLATPNPFADDPSGASDHEVFAAPAASPTGAPGRGRVNVLGRSAPNTRNVVVTNAGAQMRAGRTSPGTSVPTSAEQVRAIEAQNPGLSSNVKIGLGAGVALIVTWLITRKKSRK